MNTTELIIRHMYRAQCKKNELDHVKEAFTSISKDLEKFISQEKLVTISAYHWDDMIFLYYETLNSTFDPEEQFNDLSNYLLDWPGKPYMRKWIPMIDAFHFNAPASLEHWSRKEPVERRVGKIAYLKPEMVASYIYYHYQLQEERAFLGEKYKYISIHENLLFMYFELPDITEEPVLPKKLNTHSTPENWADSHMELHFKPWEDDGYLYFKEMEQIFAL